MKHSERGNTLSQKKKESSYSSLLVYAVFVLFVVTKLVIGLCSLVRSPPNKIEIKRTYSTVAKCVTMKFCSCDSSTMIE